MPKLLADRKVSTLVLITIVGLIIGSYLSLLVGMLPGDSNVVKELFTFNFLPLTIGYPEPLSVDIDAIKFKFAFGLNVNIMSIIGVMISLWAYRWFR